MVSSRWLFPTRIPMIRRSSLLRLSRKLAWLHSGAGWSAGWVPVGSSDAVPAAPAGREGRTKDSRQG